MTEFVRVRQAEGPKHEFDISVPELEANPDLYVVIDPEPVTSPRDATYGDSSTSAPKKPRPAGTKKPAAKQEKPADSPADPPQDTAGQQTAGQQ